MHTYTQTLKSDLTDLIVITFDMYLIGTRVKGYIHIIRIK